jgi:hypothetical protein
MSALRSEADFPIIPRDEPLASSRVLSRELDVRFFAERIFDDMTAMSIEPSIPYIAGWDCHVGLVPSPKWPNLFDHFVGARENR